MTEKPKIDSELRSKLNNSGFQRGLTWRNEKIQAVAEARHKGISEKEIFRELKILYYTNTDIYLRQLSRSIKV